MSEDRGAVDLEILREGSAELGVQLDPDQQKKVVAYLDLLYVWNRAAGLTTIPRSDAMRLHVLDSLAALDLLVGGPCLDLGTGAGLPGIVLAIADSSLSFTLVESNRKRCSFLLEVLRVLRLPNVSVTETAVEAFPREPRFPVVMSRAFRQPVEFLEIASHFVAPGGHVLLMVADMDDHELTALGVPFGLSLDAARRLRLPGGREPRTVARFRSEAEGRS